jgi:hypothetical protein
LRAPTMAARPLKGADGRAVGRPRACELTRSAPSHLRRKT